MSLEMVLGLAMLRWSIFGYIAYRLASRVNWPLLFFYLKGGFEA